MIANISKELLEKIRQELETHSKGKRISNSDIQQALVAQRIKVSATSIGKIAKGTQASRFDILCGLVTLLPGKTRDDKWVVAGRILDKTLRSL